MPRPRSTAWSLAPGLSGDLEHGGEGCRRKRPLGSDRIDVLRRHRHDPRAGVRDGQASLYGTHGLLDGKPDLLRGQVLRVEGEWADVATANGLQQVRFTLPVKPGDLVGVRQGNVVQVSTPTTAEIWFV